MRHTQAMNFANALARQTFLGEARSRLMNALFPPRCGGCGRFSLPVFCERCAPQLRALDEPCCAQCGRAFDPLAFSDAICARCRQHPPAFAKARAAWTFEGPPRAAIHRFKYNRRFSLAPRLARPMAQTPAARVLIAGWRPQCLVPVALHASRARARGFNQSALLARELGLLFELPALDLIERTRRTPPQVGLDLTARRRNVRDAFAVNENLWSQHNLNGARVLLIDDVFTTGATLDECARVLRRAGAESVGALTIARQQRPDEPLPPPNNFAWNWG